MKRYANANDTIRVGAIERNGKYVIIVEKGRKMLVATRNKRSPHVEVYYDHYEKEFDNKDKANAYFKGIKKNNPTLKRIWQEVIL